MTDPLVQGRLAAVRFRLPFQRQAWRGAAGNWAGAGVGISLDFQDHRPYLPGDDPRYIDWQAYARTGHYIMKLYREEVCPRVDLVLDASASMRLTPAKSGLAAALFRFAIESATRSGATVEASVADGPAARPVSPAERLSIPAPWNTPDPPESADGPRGAGGPPNLDRHRWRHGSMRVLVSDLLYPGDPGDMLRRLSAGRGRGVVLCPFDPSEADPDWDGNLELEDCESGAARRQRVTVDLLERYRTAYRRHFDNWRDAARRHGVALAVIPAGPDLADLLRRHALPEGAVEPCN